MKSENVKSRYDALAKKYKAPSFKEINLVFEIDHIKDSSENLLREIRKSMMDKVVSYMRLLEMILNPQQAPPLFTLFIKEVTSEEKKTIENAYMSFVELELTSLRLDVEYAEKKEAEAISKIFKTWKGMKNDLLSIFNLMERNWKSAATKKEKSYFG